MIDYETIYSEANDAARAHFRGDQMFTREAHQAALTAGIAAVVAAAKREALTEAKTDITSAAVKRLDADVMEGMSISRRSAWADGVIYAKGVLAKREMEGLIE